MVDNPDTVLHAAVAGQHITSTITLHVSTTDNPVPRRDGEYHRGLPADIHMPAQEFPAPS